MEPKQSRHGTYQLRSRDIGFIELPEDQWPSEQEVVALAKRTMFTDIDFWRYGRFLCLTEMEIAADTAAKLGIAISAVFPYFVALLRERGYNDNNSSEGETASILRSSAGDHEVSMTTTNPMTPLLEDALSRSLHNTLRRDTRLSPKNQIRMISFLIHTIVFDNQIPKWDLFDTNQPQSAPIQEHST